MDLNRLEVLAPAGDYERFRAALDYGADAVYLGGKSFGMRAAPQNFTHEDLKKAVEEAHEKGVKVYLTCNTLPRNDEIPFFEQFMAEAVDSKVDAVIVADLGLMSLVKKFAPDMEIHMSTQTGIVNYVSANELYNMGAKRVVLARELSLEEVAEIRAKTPADLDIEVFVHGAMCMSFSGRCLPTLSVSIVQFCSVLYYPCFYSLFYFSNYCKAVAQGKNNLLDTWVLFYQSVESSDALCVCVVSVGLNHMAVPQGVVGKNPTAGVQMLHHHFVVLGVLSLVAVDEGKVELYVQPGNLVECAAYPIVNLAAHGRLFEPFAGKILEFVVDVKGV